MQFFQIIKVEVEVIDINDHWPQFPEYTVEHEILESALVGSSFIVPAAEDPDGPGYGIKKYRLTPDMPQFKLQVTQKVDGSTELKVMLKQALDHEQQHQFEMQVFTGDLICSAKPKGSSCSLEK